MTCLIRNFYMNTDISMNFPIFNFFYFYESKFFLYFLRPCCQNNTKTATFSCFFHFTSRSILFWVIKLRVLFWLKTVTRRFENLRVTVFSFSSCFCWGFVDWFLFFPMKMELKNILKIKFCDQITQKGSYGRIF